MHILMLALFYRCAEGVAPSAGRGEKANPPMTAERNDPPPKRRNMTRNSPAAAAQDSWRPGRINYPPMRSIAPTIMATASVPAEPTGRQEGARTTVTNPAPHESKQFEKATARMKSPALWKVPLHRPKKQCLNDDVRLEAYEPTALSFADKQRRGAHEAFDGCSPTKEHIRRAVKHPFPLASETPIPREKRKAAQFVAGN